MELRKAWDFRKIATFVYFALLSVYLAVGLSPAFAVDYEVTAELEIPTIGLKSDVTTLHLRDHILDTPGAIVGSFTRAKHKTLLVGHASTVFRMLSEVQIGDEIIYDDTIYVVRGMEVLDKASISMETLLEAAEYDTLVVMTCAGEDLGGGDATHRLIVTAEAKL